MTNLSQDINETLSGQSLSTRNSIKEDLLGLEEAKKEFDWIGRGDYRKIIQNRAERFHWLAEDVEATEAYKLWYATHPWDFCDHWGHTIDPRLVNQGKKSHIPFILFDKQVEYMKWLEERYTMQEHGISVKCRDFGCTWCGVVYGVCKWLFVPGFICGFGSRKEEYVDQSNNMKAMFQRAMHQVYHTPRFLWPPDLVWKKGKPTPNSYAHMRLENPTTGSYLVGEAGNNIGRGDRYSMCFVDEASFVANQQMVNAALSNTTLCQIDVSTPNGTGNEFYRKHKRYEKTRQHFWMRWRDDPRKDQAWYDKMVEQLDPVALAQEVDGDFFASQSDSFFDSQWVEFAVDAHQRLHFEQMPTKTMTWDPADGGDPNAIAKRHGNIVTDVLSMKGDITMGEDWVLGHIDDYAPDIFIYDAEGMGSPVMKLMLKGKNFSMMVLPFYGSDSVLYPESKFTTEETENFDVEDVSGIQTNKERLENLRAQAFWWIRERLWRTWVEVKREKEGLSRGPHRNDQMISISSNCHEVEDLMAEMSIPRKMDSARNRIKVESKKELASRGVPSTNLADAFIMSEMSKHPYNKIKRLNRSQSRRRRSGYRTQDSMVGY